MVIPRHPIVIPQLFLKFDVTDYEFFIPLFQFLIRTINCQEYHW